MDSNNLLYKNKLLLLVTLAIMTFGVACSGKSATDSKSSISNGNEIAILHTSETSSEEIGKKFQAVLLEHDMDGKIMVLQKTGTETRVKYQYTGGSNISNRYGDIISAQQLNVGEVLDVTISDSTGKISDLKISDSDFEYTKVTGFDISVDENVITYGNSKYYYDDNTIFVKEGTIIQPESLNSVDTLTIKGKDKQLDSVIVTNGHGYVKLSSTTFFEGGYIEIGSSIVEMITDNMLISVPSGTFNLTVTKDKTSGSKDITVYDNEETAVDLLQFQTEAVRLGTLSFNIDPAGAKLTIDGVDKDYSQIVDVAYGTHKIVVSMEGYESYAQVINVDATYTEYKIALIKSAETGTETSGDESTEEKKDTASTKTTENQTAKSNKETKKETTTTATIDYSGLLDTLFE